MVKGQLIYQIW